MTRGPSRSSLRATAAFTLVELIGVMAILAVLASVLVPNVLRSVDRAAVNAEASTLAALGEQTRAYLRINGTAPTPANWTTALGTLASLAPADIARNRRALTRVYLVDPAAVPAPRAMILSSMRTGLSLPLPADITTAAQFQRLWRTADKAVPPAASWTGWSAWTAVRGSGEYLLIERINFAPIYATDLANTTLTLNHRGTATASYNLVLPSGTNQAAVDVAPGGNVVLAGVLPRTRLNLYRAAGGATLNYTYVVGPTGRTFDFDGTNWIPQ